MEPPPQITEPVVSVALRRLTRLVDPTGNGVSLAESRDRRSILDGLRLLLAGSHDVDRSEVVAWAAANGWNPAGVKELDRLLAMFEQGRTPRGPRGEHQRLEPHALDRWRQEAGYPHPQLYSHET